MSGWQQMFDADVLTLGMAADEERRRSRPDKVVTYRRVFARTARANATVPEAATEVRLHETPLTLDDATALVRSMVEQAQGRRVVAFSAAEIERRGWGASAGVWKALAEAGLADVAELPLDVLTDASATIEGLCAAGIQPRRLTIAQPVGDRTRDLIERARELFARHSSLRRFAPLPRMAPIDTPTTGYDDVRMVALARLALPGQSIEVDWQLYGPKLAQVALTFGADHLDAVAATAGDASLGARRGTVEDVERNIRAAGFEPREDRSDT